MNALLKVTKLKILQRKQSSTDGFFDNYILNAIDAYSNTGSQKRRAQDFINSLLPVWEEYNKGTYVPVFKSFVEFELGLESVGPKYSAHINHVIQEFLLGYNIITSCEQFKRDYNCLERKNNPRSKFNLLLFSWMAASLFHDIGYDIEKAIDEEKYREEKNKFWNFMTERAITKRPLLFSETEQIKSLVDKYLLAEINLIPGFSKLDCKEFMKLFERTKANGWITYDHGIISALKYLFELQYLEEMNSNLNYLNWSPNKRAILAMALHNFRYKNIDLNLSSSNSQTFLAYLLTICDEVQEWERGRDDFDAELSPDIRSGKDLRTDVELKNIKFENTNSHIVVNHKLIPQAQRQSFEKYLFEKIILQKKHFPIEVKILINSNYTPENQNQFLQRSGHHTSLEYLQKIKETKTEKKLLSPTEPNPAYQVFLQHNIDDTPFLETMFPF